MGALDPFLALDSELVIDWLHASATAGLLDFVFVMLTRVCVCSKLAIDTVKDCIKQVKANAEAKPRKFAETVELQIGEHNRKLPAVLSSLDGRGYRS